MRGPQKEGKEKECPGKGGGTTNVGGQGGPMLRGIKGRRSSIIKILWEVHKIKGKR